MSANRSIRRKFCQLDDNDVNVIRVYSYGNNEIAKSAKFVRDVIGRRDTRQCAR